MIKVTYYYSACVAITTPDVSILCDPWFTDGIYDGAWYQYPKIKNPIELIGKHDIIYVSHIHPDHYDPVFLKEYLKVYPETEIIIAEGVFLDKKMDADGIPYRFMGMGSEDQIFKSRNTRTVIGIIKNDTGSISDIDTALLVTTNEISKDKSTALFTVVNMNDNQYYQPQIDQIKMLTPDIDIALLGHAGAGPYPQTYYKYHEHWDLLQQKVEEKKQEFFRRYTKMADALGAKVNIPFAGQYILGGRLSYLNKYRGMSDATEVLAFDPNAMVLEVGASIDTEKLEPFLPIVVDKNLNDISYFSALRTKPYDTKEMEAYASTLTEPMDYMKDFKYLSADSIPWGRLLRKAYHNAMHNIEYEGEVYKIILKISQDRYFYMHLSNPQDCYMNKYLIPNMRTYSLIEIDYRYLFGLITGVYHWNNAEVGSQYMTTRVPDVYNRSVQRFLNFFVV